MKKLHTLEDVKRTFLRPNLVLPKDRSYFYTIKKYAHIVEIPQKYLLA